METNVSAATVMENTGPLQVAQVLALETLPSGRSVEGPGPILSTPTSSSRLGVPSILAASWTPIQGISLTFGAALLP